MTALSPLRDPHHVIRSSIDCVVIGYNDIDFGQVATAARETDGFNPFYSELKRSSAVFDGKRMPYMDLLNSSIHAATGRDPGLHMCELPNLGVIYLTSFLRRRGFRIEAINHFNAELDALNALLDERPTAVAITTTFYVDAAPIEVIVNYVRERSPETRIIVGGPHIYNICSDYDAVTQDYLLDSMGGDIFIFDSQGEASLAGTLEALRNGGDLTKVTNLIYSDGKGGFNRTERLVEDNDMDAEVVDWTLFEEGTFVPTVQMRTARSCAFACAFCRYPAVAGPLNLNSVECVENQLRVLKSQGVENVVFIDDTFNVPLPRFKDLCRMMIKNDFGFRWYSYFRCSNADEITFDLMAEAGCKGTFLGVESGDQDMLNNMNKAVKLERYRNGIDALKSRGIATHTSLIFGYPGETRSTVANTQEFIEETAPTFYSGGVWFHEPKAPIDDRKEEFGIEGSGMNWKHNTMDWSEANGLVDEVYRSIKNSTILPTYMFDFWSIPYLVGRGVSVEHLEGFTKLAGERLIDGLSDEGGSKSGDEKLVDYWREEGASAPIMSE